MALSPEDVVKKQFQTTQLKKGYKEHEVDDFLDEVVVELRRLGAEKSSLSADLADCRASKGWDPKAAGPGSDTAAATAPGAQREELARLQRERDELVAEIDELSARAGQQRESLAGSDEQGAAAVASAPAATEDPGSIISLARRVHDEHIAEGENTKAQLVSEAESYRDTTVREAESYRDTTVREADSYRDNTVREADERNATLIDSAQLQHDELVATGQHRHDELVEHGQSTHDRLVEEGQSTHDRLVSEGQATRQQLISEGEQTRDQMVGEAEQRRSNVLADLGTQRAGITATIEELKGFESDYRGRLRELLSEQMSLLDRDAQLS